MHPAWAGIGHARKGRGPGKIHEPAEEAVAWMDLTGHVSASPCKRFQRCQLAGNPAELDRLPNTAHGGEQ